MSKAKEAFLERERAFERERRIKEREDAEDAKRRRDIRDAMLRQRDIDNPPPQPRYRPRTPSPDWNPPEEESEVEEGEEELVADLSFFPADEEVPGWGDEGEFDWALDGISLDPDADLPAVSGSQFAEIAGIMEDARQDQVVGAIAVDDDFWIEEDSEEEDSDVWETDLIPDEPPPEVQIEERRMIHIPQREVVPKRREKPFSKATGEMRGRNPNRLGWRFPRKPYGSHRRLLPIVNISREEERRLVSEVPRRVLVQSVLDWAKDNNVRFRPSITREHKGQILAEIRRHSIPVPRLSGGYYGDGKPSAHKDGEDIDFERMKWGSFTKQAKREGFDDLGRFAREVLANPKNYYSTTRRRAHFYLNVLEPETVGRGGGKICPKTGKLGCVCLTRDDFIKEHKAIVKLLEDTADRLKGEAEEQGAELKAKTGVKTGGKLGAVGDPSLLESKRENPVVEEVITDPMDDKDIRYYYPKAPILKYSDLANYSTIEQLLPADKSMVFLLYQHSYNNGHWVLLTRYAPNTFEFFCSYGSAIDEPLTWTRAEQREALGEAVPYLTNMLKKWKGKIAVNRKQFQQKGHSVATCGAYCVMRTACLKNDDMNLVDFQQYLEKLKRETGLSYDEVVANFVSHR